MKPTAALFEALNRFEIEVPSWGFADTGTRFGKYLQPAAAISLEDKLADAGQVHRLTGCCPTVAVHVLWDFTKDLPPAKVARLARSYGVKIGSINPNLFQHQEYKFGSFGNPDPKVRSRALDHVKDSIGIATEVNSRYVTLWFADGSNYPGAQNIRERKEWFEQALKKAHASLKRNQVLLVEYKPFEPAFYHTDIMDWGAAYLLAKSAGRQAKVLVDTGHHYPSQNIEQIVAWLLSENMLGGFHFNDRRYADDDLTLGSIDPYQIFRIFHEIQTYEWEKGSRQDIAYMIDQSHNIKPKIEAMIQTVMTAQELWAKAALVDRKKLAVYQRKCQLVDAENCLKDAFATDVRPLLAAWRRSKGLAADPLVAHRKSGYEAEAARERTARRKALGLGGGGSYA